MIELKNVSAGYRKKKIIEGISFSLKPGAWGLLGPNGAGKTTLLRAMSGVIPFTGEMRPDVSTGYLPQQFGFYQELTVAETMSYFALLCRIPEEEAAEETERCLALTNMKQYADKRVKTLSGGMLRRLGIAQAFLGKPELLLLDEPTTGLDPEERMRFKEMVRQVKGECTILISTHIVEDVKGMCDGVLIMQNGRILCTEHGPLLPLEEAGADLESRYLSFIHHETI